MLRILIACIGMMPLLLGSQAVAQNNMPEPNSSESTTPGNEAQAFAEAVAAYKAAISDIDALRSEYQVAEESERGAINEKLKKLVADTQAKVDAMVEAGIVAYKANPEADDEITNLLSAVVGYQMVGNGPQGGGDDYEAALPILEALIEGGNQSDELPVWAFLAAFVTNQHDLADKYADLVMKSGALSKDPGENQYAQETFGITSKFMRQREEYRKLWETESAMREAEATADNLPRVKFVTSKGDIVIELFEDQAPTATANFITLVKDGFYNDVVFHRVLSRFMAQGGDPTGTGTGGPGYTIPCECNREDARKHFRGSLSMAHAGKDTGGSQFFLTFVPTDHLDGRHTVFGRVIDGFGVLGALNRVDPSGRGPKPPTDRIISAEVLRDRGHGYEFKKQAK